MIITLVEGFRSCTEFWLKCSMLQNVFLSVSTSLWTAALWFLVLIREYSYNIISIYSVFCIACYNIISIYSVFCIACD